MVIIMMLLLGHLNPNVFQVKDTAQSTRNKGKGNNCIVVMLFTHRVVDNNARAEGVTTSVCI